MLVVFLDCDGVLNSPDYSIYRHVRRRAADGLPVPPIDPGCVGHLNTLTDRTGARIVVSSTWRKMGLRRIRMVLRDDGVTAPIIGVTPDLSHQETPPLYRAVERGQEIQWWLDHVVRRVERFVILDDDADMGALLDRLVRTDFRAGLTAEDVERAVALLTDTTVALH